MDTLPTEPVAEAQTSNPEVRIVADTILTELADNPTQFYNDGFPRVFNRINPKVPNTPLRSLDRVLFAPFIDEPNAIGQGDEIDTKLKQISEAGTQIMLTPEGKVFEETTLNAFTNFRQVVNEFRGGGKDSILPEGTEKESETFTYNGKEYKKYDRYWDWAPKAFPGNGAWDTDRPRNTMVFREFTADLRNRQTELIEKLKSPDANKQDIQDFMSNLYLLRFAEYTRWTEKGSPVKKEVVYN